jgi:hypothetical protein
MPLGVGDGQLFPGFLLAILSDILPREDIAVFAPEGAEELKGSPPPGALTVGTAFIGLRRRHVQDARKSVLGLVLHLHGSIYQCTHNRTTRTQIAALYAAVMHRTQELPDLAEQPDWWEGVGEIRPNTRSAC